MIIRRKIKTRSVLFAVLALLIAVFTLLPLMWTLATSLRLPRNSMRLPPDFFPRLPLVWNNYAEVFRAVPFFRFFINSFVVAGSAMSLQLVCSAMAAFALSRIPFKGNQAVFLAILSGMMVPAQVTIIPLFIMLSKIGLYDSLLSLILPSLVFPIGVFLLRQFMATIPPSYDEAVYLDGGNRWTVFSKIIIPMVRAPLTIAGIMHFLIVWNDFFRPLIFINSPKNMTLPVGLFTLNGHMGNGSVSVILAGVILTLIPPLLLYIFGQKYIVEGTTVGGIKG